MIQQTSILSYQQIARSRELGDVQKQIVLLLKSRGAMNNRLIAFELNKPINCITPRVKELREAGFVRESFRGMDHQTNRRTIFWEAII